MTDSCTEPDPDSLREIKPRDRWPEDRMLNPLPFQLFTFFINEVIGPEIVVNENGSVLEERAERVERGMSVLTPPFFPPL